MSSPRILTVPASRITDHPEVEEVVREIRRYADALVFLSGGASQMSAGSEQAVLALIDGLAILAGSGLRFAVGDGGTDAGIMQAAGRARQHSTPSFPLIGVCPARELTPLGTSAVEPNHTVIIAVDDPEWVRTDDGYFGCETRAMYHLFATLASGRPSVAIVANGGRVTLSEVDQNLCAARPVILLRGSGRAADTLASMLNPGVAPAEPEAELETIAESLNLLRQPGLLHLFDLRAGPHELARVLRAVLRR